jgi:alpha-glucosidase
MPSQPLWISMNQLSNHDHSRFLTRTSGRPGRLGQRKAAEAAKGVRKGVFMEAAVVLMTWPGMPTLYYGDEAGLCGFTDPDNRRTYPWGREDRLLLSFHREIIRLHKAFPCIRFGSLKPLLSAEGMIAYARFDSESALAVVLNNNKEEKEVTLPLVYGGFPMEGEARRVFMTRGGKRPSFAAADLKGPAGKGEREEIRGGQATLRLPPESSLILAWEEA